MRAGGGFQILAIHEGAEFMPRNKTVLISTIEADFHSHCVAMAIEAMGHHATLWYSAELGTGIQASIRHPGGDSGRGVTTFTDDCDSLPDKPDTIWMRRPQQPVVKGVHEDDREFARIEARDFDRNIWAMIGREALWVNEPDAARRSNNKAVQLQAAHRLGIQTPETLFSNHPRDIRDFISDQGGRVIFKTYHPGFWSDGSIRAAAFSARVTADSLPGDHLLQASPGIFQQEIAKDFEVRVNCLGDTVIPVRLNSQGGSLTEVDWRVDPQGVPTQPIRLPKTVEKQCRDLMRALGLAYGAMDWIVTPEGDYVFLEVNEQGQCLWVEESCSDIPMLQCLSEYLVFGEVRSDPQAPPNEFRVADFCEGVTKRIKTEKQLSGDDRMESGTA